jgi:hypothetical protein
MKGSASAPLGHNERHPLGHEAGDERHVPRQAIKLGDQDCAAFRSGRCKCRRELRPAIEGVGALARLGLGELGDNREPFGFSKAGYSSLPRLLPKA